MSMFGRLALTILFWGCASAVRLTDSDGLEEPINPKAGPLPRKVRLAVFTQAQAKVNSTAPIREAIQKAFLRGCLLQVAHEREAFYHGQHVTWPAPPEGNISTALEALFEAEDSGNPVSVPMEQVKQMGLKLDAATDFCNNDGGEPLHRVEQECMVDFANRDRTRTRSWFRTGRGEKALKSTSEDLPSWLEERFAIEHALQLMLLSSDDFLRDAQGADGAQEEHAARLESNKQQIKATGYSVTHTEHHCKNLHKDETKQAEELYMERVGLELARAQARGGCSEGEQGPCPESTSPQHTRAFRTGRFAATYAAVWGLAWVAVPVISTLVLGAQTGGAFSAAFFLIPGAQELSSLPFAAIAGIPVFGDCACRINPCEWNAEEGVCAFTPSSTSTNEYQWLPYPGTKCAPSDDSAEDTPECMMQVCGPEDFQTVRQDQPFGKLGLDAPATVNCLSDDGTRHGDLGMKEQLPNQQQNTPENRNALYAELNPTKPSYVMDDLVGS